MGGDLSDFDIPIGDEPLEPIIPEQPDIEEEHEETELEKTIKFIERETREHQSPYFEPGDIIHYLEKNNGDINATIYELLIIKSEDSSINLSGLVTMDTSEYFKRLASRYKTYNTGNLIGG